MKSVHSHNNSSFVKKINDEDDDKEWKENVQIYKWNTANLPSVWCILHRIISAIVDVVVFISFLSI